MDKAKSLLKEVFGYESFRPLQHEIIQNILNKKDSLIVMPTGGGKSLCYQIPALIFDGLTIVISPLISLMRDQVEQLRQLGVRTALLNSSLPQNIYRQNFINVQNNKVNLLYLAPESLFKEEILRLISSVKLDCITVDEAHCISEWGHDFRPEYRQLGILRKKFPNAVCAALTATATPRVQNDIMTNLNLINGSKFIASFNRENLFLQVIPKSDPFLQTVNFLQQRKDHAGIIYCFSRKQVDTLSEDLSALGYSCKPYHAGLTDEERTKNQDLFINDEIQIIVATIAFGMGINKSNVRFVIHYDLPKNIESYYQEIGRSGRDGTKADCLLLFSYADIAKINYFIDQKENPVEQLSARAHLNAMVKYAEYDACRRTPLISYFGEKYFTENCGMCDNCLAEEREFIDITIPAQKFLSAIKRSGEIFGAKHIIDILTGSESEKIFSNNHQNLTVYGIGKDLSKKQWMNFCNQLIQKELIYKDLQFGSLKLTVKAKDVLFKGKKVQGYVKEREIDYKKAKHVDQIYNKELFDLLRQKRKQLAEKMRIPPYVIFPDKALMLMAVYYPQSEENMLRISGVGRVKFQRYGFTFLSVIKNFCSKNKIAEIRNLSPVKESNSKRVEEKLRHIEVGELYNSGDSIETLMQKYDVKLSTILSNLYRFTKEGMEIRIDGITTLTSVDETNKLKIFSLFESEGTEKLKPIFEKMEAKISYDDLHVLRLMYVSKKWI